MLALVLAGGLALALRDGTPAASTRADRLPPQATAGPAACAFDPMAPERGSGDGQLRLRTDLDGKTAADAAGLVWLAHEVAGQGRTRDTEVALIMACRLAARLDGPQAPAVAEAKYQLGRHYLALVAPGGASALGGGTRGDMLRRAQEVLQESRHAFTAQYGDAHAKTQLAAAAAATAQQSLTAVAARPPNAVPPAAVPPAAVPPAAVPGRPPEAVAAAPESAPPPPPAPAPQAQQSQQAPPQAQPPAQASAPRPEPAPPPPAVAAKPAPPPPAVTARPAPPPVASGKPAPAPVPPAVAGRTTPPDPAVASVKPSFDCAKARSVPEKMICSDAELARLDRELGRLHAQAKRAAPSTTAFNRKNNEEWNRREATCRTRSCLLQWYAERRQQLEGDLRRSQDRTTASR
ncbi:lysozyme inhibitor LprI family protein [Ramlibacter tataouinensis]|nr:hypothetical protein [Ramlibacter tataouinensis]